MSVAMLADHGVTVHREGKSIWHVDPQSISACDVRIEPDLSNATPFLAAAMVTGGSVTVADWPVVTTQPGAAILPLLEHMGATWTRSIDGVTVHGPDTIDGIDADLADVGELTPTVAALAAFADSPSTLTGIAHLRGHETDRIAALATELGKIGAHVVELPDGLRIEPGPPRAADLATYHDHRMATAAAIVGLRIPGVRVADIETTSKTLPDFPGMWSALVDGA
jgi:3-phosphoshikimate 1-carboxyvinyltransferase